MKMTISISLFVLLTACITTPKSAYESGWTNDISEKTYTECAPVWLNNILIPERLDDLVRLGHLNNEEAKRAKLSEVRVGDPECMAYAANGLFRTEVTYRNNKEGQLTSKSFTYSCKNGPAKCPGTLITIVDAQVSNISTRIKTKELKGIDD